MLKDSEIQRYTARRTHRTYTSEFKAELVAACQKPGTSIAALASAHAMNANVLHRWLKEHAQTGRHRVVGGKCDVAPRVVDTARPQLLKSIPPTFIPVTLPIAAPVPVAQEIKVEIQRGALTMNLTWPMSAASDFANLAAALLK